MAISTYLSIITLSVNELKAEWIKRENKTYVYVAYKRLTTNLKDTQTVSEEMVKKKKKICHANGNEKKTGIGIFILRQNRV